MRAPALGLRHAPRPAHEREASEDIAEAVAVLRRALATVSPGRLIMTTSFGPGGMVLLHMLRTMEVRLPIVFVDTLHHFPTTLRFARETAGRWALDLQMYRAAPTRVCFEAVHGRELWKYDLDRYHRLTKVAPLERALEGVEGWITARRRDQAESRRGIPHVETGTPTRFNPLARWSRTVVWEYVRSRDIPYHPLHDRGYPSIGDEPLTSPVERGEHERAGRWRGTDRTECGIHAIGRSGRVHDVEEGLDLHNFSQGDRT